MGAKPTKPSEVKTETKSEQTKVKTTNQETETKELQTTSQVSELKILLLGTSESGKSTFYENVKTIYHPSSYTSEEIQSYKGLIYSKLLLSLKVICKICLEKDQFEIEVNQENAKTILALCEDEDKVTQTAGQIYSKYIHNIIEQLLKDSKFQKVLQENMYQVINIFEGAKHFLNQIAVLEPSNYTPTPDDIQKSKKKVVGLIQTSFEFEKVKFTIFDLGGQRNERKKWANCFQGSNGIIFFASLADYDLKCYEDDVTNRMLENLELFEEIINNKDFKDKPIVLILNKEDIFKQKISNTDLKYAFPEYEGGCDYEKALEFIKTKYLSLDKGKNRLQIYTCISNSPKIVEDVLTKIENGFVHH